MFPRQTLFLQKTTPVLVFSSKVFVYYSLSASGYPVRKRAAPTSDKFAATLLVFFRACC